MIRRIHELASPVFQSAEDRFYYNFVFELCEYVKKNSQTFHKAREIAKGQGVTEWPTVYSLRIQEPYINYL